MSRMEQAENICSVALGSINQRVDFNQVGDDYQTTEVHLGILAPLGAGDQGQLWLIAGIDDRQVALRDGLLLADLVHVFILLYMCALRRRSPGPEVAEGAIPPERSVT